jgi:hypothetical protein
VSEKAASTRGAVIERVWAKNDHVDCGLVRYPSRLLVRCLG